MRFTELPMSPPRVLEALDEQRERLQAAGGGVERGRSLAAGGAKRPARQQTVARVNLMSSLTAFTGRREPVLEVDAANVHQLMRRLERAFPALAPHLDDSLAVAIDGEIHQDDWFAEHRNPESEVHIMPRIGGG